MKQVPSTHIIHDTILVRLNRATQKFPFVKTHAGVFA
jgi:hypothetical protein